MAPIQAMRRWPYCPTEEPPLRGEELVADLERKLIDSGLTSQAVDFFSDWLKRIHVTASFWLFSFVCLSVTDLHACVCGVCSCIL